MFVTKNTEYHFRDGLCVAVRDRETGHFRLAHLALRRRVSGSVRVNGGTVVPSLDGPRVGEALYFGTEGRELVTSALLAIERPAKALVQSYPV